MSLVGNGFTTSDAKTGQRMQVNVVVNGGDDLNFTAATCGDGADLGFCFFNCGEGAGTITLSKPGYQTRIMAVTFPIATNIDYALEPTVTPAPPTGPLTTSGPIFLSDGQPWRYKGVSAFSLCHRFRNGESIDGFLSDYAGFNVLRVWDYTNADDGWGDDAWESCDAATWIRFIDYVSARGFYVEVTLLTDDDPARIEPARQLLKALSEESKRRANQP